MVWYLEIVGVSGNGMSCSANGITAGLSEPPRATEARLDSELFPRTATSDLTPLKQ